ncbi:hypothetical protein GCM10007242_16860 [Pigmentiphaga litoralis]|uniref:hypothetical protein n=1 Tax=Pigmentiphaga litoralis TaxID=516702 RepID=UPI0016740587|nr:hypothetical protein [Pigmentiphaga litoralis]GGX11370.1 hypothetical protein GCM10007242_16860 [Pigmentiphaga litoralis]
MTTTHQAPATAVVFDCYSTNGEEYRSGELHDAIDELEQESDGAALVGRSYWLGVSRKPKPSDFFSIDRLLEDMQEQADDQHGEFAEDFLTDLSTEKVNELQALIGAWIDANATVSFYRVHDTAEFTITEQDLKDRGHE